MGSTEKFLIWSNHERAWYGHEHRAYTTVTLNAGLFSAEEADRIRTKANQPHGVCDAVIVAAPPDWDKHPLYRNATSVPAPGAGLTVIPPEAITVPFVDELRELLVRHCFVIMKWPAHASIEGYKIPGFLHDLSALINRCLPRWLHMKRHRIYTEIARGPLQASKRPAVEGDIIVCYQGEGGDHYFREATEFEDGRFQPLSQVNPDLQIQPAAHEQSK